MPADCYIEQILPEWDSFLIGWIASESFLFRHLALVMKLENSPHRYLFITD